MRISRLRSFWVEGSGRVGGGRGCVQGLSLKFAGSGFRVQLLRLRVFGVFASGLIDSN